MSSVKDSAERYSGNKNEGPAIGHDSNRRCADGPQLWIEDSTSLRSNALTSPEYRQA
jgi:hypothetical protein